MKKAIAEITPQLILDAVDELHDAAARQGELGYKLADAQSTGRPADPEGQPARDEEKFLAALKQEGMTRPICGRSLEKQMIISRMQGQEVMQKVGITEEEARAYHAEHQGVHEARLGDAARDSMHVAATAQGVSAAKKRRPRSLEEMRARVKDGEAFEKVAGRCRRRRRGRTAASPGR